MLKWFLSQDGFDEMLERLKSVIDNLVNKLNAHKLDSDVHTTAAEKAKWNSTSSKLTDDVWVDLMSAKNKAHTHDNKDTLDSITNDAWLRAYGMSHEHSNKDTLDRITAQDYADFKGAVNKAHVHDNKETLDKIDETAWATVYGQTHEHENKETLDRLTSAVWIDLMNAKNKAHVHDNMDTLDKIDDVSWLKVYGQAHEHDNKDTLDKLTAQDYSDFKGAVNKAHTHSNKDTLDKIDDVSWLAVYGQKHEHENKDVLDRFTAQDYTDFQSTKNKAHTHSNKATLDKLDGDWWTQWLAAYGNMHTHSNKAILDQLNQEQWTFINSAANKAHTHDNKETLDGITSAAWLTVYGNTHTHDNKDVLDKTTASYTAADKAKLDGMDLSQYLPLHGTADTATKLATPRTINGVAFDGTANITIPRSHRYVVAAGGTIGKTGFVKIATFKVGATYANMPTIVRYRNRGRFPVYLIFRFKNQNTTDPELDAFAQIIELTNYGYMSAFLHKSATSTWDLYIAKSEAYDSVQILDCQIADGVALTYTNTHADTLPSEAVTATIYTRAFTSSTVANATTWNGLTQDCDTYNSTDTWLLVKNGDKIQHRLSYELKVKEAATLTDSGWISLPVVSGVTPTTNYNGVKYRKQGKIVAVQGAVVFASDQSGPTIGQLPDGFRPVNGGIIKPGLDGSTYNTYYISIGTDGKILFSTKTQGFFKKNTAYTIDVVFFVD